MEEGVNVGIVTENSLEKARKYSQDRNYGRAFAHYLVVFQLSRPEERKQYEKDFVTVLHIWGSTLYKKGRYEDIFRCYNLALSYFPNNVEILNNLGVHALKLNCLRPAKNYFETACSLDPNFLPAEQNLQTTKIGLVERWHFPMLNDTVRNKAFAQAIFLGISKGFTKILDVGTGTGILSLFASKSKQTKSITACDYSETMYEIATNVIKTNNITNIKLINKKSTKLKIPKDIKEKASLLVTEILDSGVFGEDVLQTLIHAWDHLLVPYPYGIVIPSSVSIYIMGVESTEIIRKTRLIPKNILKLNELCIYYDTGLYDTENLRTTHFTNTTTPQMCLEVDFNNILQLKTIVESYKHNPKTQLRCVRNGIIDCFVMWFKLTLIDDVSLSNDPTNQTCWDQAVIPLKHALSVNQNDLIEIQISCVDGKLNIPSLSNLPQPNHKCHEVTKEQIYFLNDTTFMETLQKLTKKLADRFVLPEKIQILDLSPFPIFGLLLAQHGCKSTFVASDTESLCIDICNINGIDCRNIKFITSEELNNYPNPNDGFDVIFQNLISINGLVDEAELYQGLLMRHSVNPTGVYIPQRIVVWAQIVQCEWITRVTTVDDKNLCGFKIAQFINEYKTTEQQDMNFNSIHHTNLSEPEKLGEIEWNIMNPTINTTLVKITESGKANAIFYWFELQLYEDLSVSTRRNDSYVNNAAFVLNTPTDLKVGDFKTVVLKQHKGIMKIFISDVN